MATLKYVYVLVGMFKQRGRKMGFRRKENQKSISGGGPA